MAKKLFSYAITDDDEAEYFGKLMEENNIDYYLVPGSVFGFTKPGFWIKNDEDFLKAKHLFNEHEEIFARLAREKYQQETGYNPHATKQQKLHFWFEYIKRRPLNLVFVIIGLALIAWYFSLFFSTFQTQVTLG